MRLRWLAIFVGLVPAMLAGCASAPGGNAPSESLLQFLPRAVAEPVSYHQELVPPPVSTEESAASDLLPAPAARKMDGAMPACRVVKPSYAARNASTIFNRDASIAGKNPPTKPISSENSSVCKTMPGVRKNPNASCEKD